MKARHTLSLALLLAGTVTAFGQNLNPTVEVTNTYQREAGGIEKPVLLLPVPDSLTQFRLDFDYSVRTTPYLGSYEFQPYQVQLRPNAQLDGQKTFFLNVGAGYPFHPELTAVWAALRKEHFHLNVYADHYSYMGLYKGMDQLADLTITDPGNLEPMSGCNSHSAVGVNALFDWKGGQLSADVRYKNIIGADVWDENCYHGIGARISACSNPSNTFQWEVSEKADWLYAEDLIQELHSQTHLGAGTRFGGHFLKLDVDAEAVDRPDNLSAGLFALTPRYIMTFGALRMDLGVKLSYMFHSTEGFYTPKSDFVFPDVHLRFGVIPEKLVLQAAATGGDRMHVYTDWLDTNPWLSSVVGVMDNSVERINFMGGVRGQLWGHFHYDLRGGYAMWKNALLWGVAKYPSPNQFRSEIDYRNYQLLYANADLGWKSDYLDVDLALQYNKTDLDEERLFAPAAFEGRFNALYNWGGRIWAGVRTDFSTERVSQEAILPGYVDLGLYGSYRITRHFGPWLRLGNLLGQTIQRVPFHAEKGVYFTLGIRWNF